MSMEITIRSVQGDRKVACEVGQDYRAEEVLEGLRDEWRLPPDHDYVLRLVRTGRQLAPGETLSDAGLRHGDELELYPVLVAGARGRGA